MTWHTVQVVPTEWLIQDGDRVVGSIVCRERRYEAEILWATGNITGSFADMASALAFVRIEPHEKDGLCYLEIGHDCVIRVRREIEVTQLAQIIADGLEDAYREHQA